MEIFPFIFMLVIAVAVIAGIVLQQRALQKRAEDVKQFAQTIGLTHYEKGDPSLLHELRSFKLFSKGRGQTITNMIRGDAEGVDLAMFDYQYTTGGGKNKQTHRQTVVFIRAEDLAAPEFALGPENLFHRIGSFLGMQDIDFAEYPQFSKMFLLRGPNEEAIRKFFTPARAAFFEQIPSLSVEAYKNQIVVFQEAHRPPPEKLQAMMNVAFEGQQFHLKYQ